VAAGDGTLGFLDHASDPLLAQFNDTWGVAYSQYLNAILITDK
jgi:hypothetical protein